MFRKGLLIMTIAMLIGTLTPASPAAAARSIEYGRFTNTVPMAGTGIHSCPANTCPVLTMVPQGAKVQDFCWREGQLLGGTKYWNLVLYNGAAGWTNEHWLTNGQGYKCDVAYPGPYLTQYATEDGAGIHTCANNGCAVLAIIPRVWGVNVLDFCLLFGQELYDVARWDLVYYNGVAGWTNEYWINLWGQETDC